MKTPTREEMKYLGESIITIGTDRDCLGDLIHFDGRGTYDAHYGKVDVTKEEADVHNKALDEARLTGLDKNCEIKQGGTFYYHPKNGVTTFLGTKVANAYVSGNTITFIRAGKTYRGKLQKEADCFNFRRVK
jgi:hypothetical protein